MKTSDKVVCVDDNFHAQITSGFFRFVGPIPKKGSVYTVEAVIKSDIGPDGLRLTGSTGFLTNLRGESEVGFRETRFRKLEDMKREASNQRPEANPVEVPVPAGVLLFWEG